MGLRTRISVPVLSWARMVFWWKWMPLLESKANHGPNEADQTWNLCEARARKLLAFGQCCNSGNLARISSTTMMYTVCPP